MKIESWVVFAFLVAACSQGADGGGGQAGEDPSEESGGRVGTETQEPAGSGGRSNAGAAGATGKPAVGGAPTSGLGGATATGAVGGADSLPTTAGGSGGTISQDSAKDPPSSCAALTAEDYKNNKGINAEFTAKFFPTEDRDHEYIDMFFRSPDLGTYLYGEGDNATYFSCDQCMLVIRNGKKFFPTAGSITIEAGSEPRGKRLFATLSQLTLIEIELVNARSVPVAGGECITLAPAIIAVE